MATLGIKKLPDGVLRKKAEPVKGMTDELRAVLDDMAQTMYLASGVGLAAPQVGICKRLAVIDVGGGLIRMANPRIMSREGEECGEEGCLSVPEVSVKIKRASRVVVEFISESGEMVRVAASGILARAIQHELDHLDGKLIVDYLGPIKRFLMRKRMK